MSAAEARRLRGLQLLHQKLRAAELLQAQALEAIKLTHAVGGIGPIEIELLETEINGLVRVIAGRRWDLREPEPITIALILAELSQEPEVAHV